MPGLFWLSDEQYNIIKPFLPNKSRGIRRGLMIDVFYPASYFAGNRGLSLVGCSRPIWPCQNAL